jgi:hypothetical protein
MKTHRRTWQRREQQAAELFGARRQPGSGSSGRDDQTASDSTHPRLFIESKLRVKHAARELLDATAKKARKEGKIPLVVLASKCKHELVICLYARDLNAIATEALAATIERESLKASIVDRDFG